MFAGKRVHLRHLRLSYFVRVSPALGDSFIMNAEHETHCTFAIHVEELFDEKFHWSVIIVQHQLKLLFAFDVEVFQSSSRALLR